MSDTRLVRISEAMKTQPEIDRDDALRILVACGQDVDLLERSLPESKKTAGFKRAIESLRQRIAVGEEMQRACAAAERRP